MERYKWESAYDWLKDKADGWDAAQLMQELLAFAQAAGNDEIQDRYQKEMDDDGFFQDLDIHKGLTEATCVRLLEDAGEEVRDEDGTVLNSVITMQNKVADLIEDGTIAYSDVENA